MAERATVRPTEGSGFRRFVRGLTYPARGAAFLLRHRDLWLPAAGPFLVTMTMLVGALWLTVLFSDNLLALFWARPTVNTPLGEAVAWHVAVRSLGVALFLLMAVVLWVVGNMIGAPFWDLLAERTERHLLDRPETPFDWRIALGDAWMSVRHSIAALILYVAVMGPLLLLNLVPGVGSVVYAAISYPASAFFVAREVMDIPLSRRRTPFRDKLSWMRGHKALLAGLGTASLVLFAVPLLNMFLMPMAVMGGTLLYCHLHVEGLGVPQRGPGGETQ